MQVSFDVNSIGIVLDLVEQRALGTGFVLLRPNWIVTAKHVVMLNGLPRTEIAILVEAGRLRARVHAVHPEVDLAVLELLEPAVCKTPLFPSYAGFTGSNGMLSLGYSPTLSKQSSPGAGVVNGYPIASYETVVRERSGGNEEVITFKAPASEGGNSGSPVLGNGGGVVGVVIENFIENGVTLARATSLVPLLRGILFTEDWRAAAQ
jgi:hypothetical protein